MTEMQFAKGQKIKTSALRRLTIEQWIGGGGQGDVYQVEYNGGMMALKWYKPNVIKDPEKFKTNMLANIRQKAPSSVFIWPEALTEELHGSFGYLMRLRPDTYVDFPKFLKAKAQFKDGQTVIRTALKMVNAFKLLHNRGCSYQDLNDGNFFIEPDTGDVLICDNDNIAPYGSTFGIAGKPGYVAPEIVLGEKEPSVHTDRFSLAVILFLLFVMARPFEGQMTTVPCLTEKHDRQFFGIDPVFIFHKSDHRNPPVRGIHGNAIRFWPTLPSYIQDAFTQTFVDAVKDRGGREDQDRTTESEWEKRLLRLRDETIVCPRCGWETVYPTDGADAACSNAACSYVFPKLLILVLERSKVVLYPSMKLYGNHIGKVDDFDILYGEVVKNKKNQNLWGIKNLSDIPWQEHTPDGNARIVMKNDAVRALSGITISFGGGITAEIQ